MLLEYFLALITSFWGSLPVGIISLVVVETTVQQGARQGVWAALGVSMVEVLQAFVALVCLSFFVDYPFLKTALLLASVPVFLVLGIQHLRHDGKPKRKASDAGVASKKAFWRGAGISSLNMVVIPYWLVWGGVFINNNQLQPGYDHFAVFALGAGTGAFFGMLLYVTLGVLAHDQLHRYNKWFNRVIGLIFLGLAAALVYKIVVGLVG